MSLNEVSAEHKVRAFEFKRLFEGFGVTAGSLLEVRTGLPGRLLDKGPPAKPRRADCILAQRQREPAYAFGKRGPRVKRNADDNSFEGKAAESTVIWKAARRPA
jgi:hypothetical protein